MASPQKEDGYLSIANEILEHLVNTPLLGSEFAVVLWVIRKTYGFNKKEDWISLTQFEKATGLSRPTVVKALKNLVKTGLLVKTASLAYSFEKDHEKWIVKPGLLVKHNDSASKDRLTEIGKHGLTHKRQPKDNTTKDITQRPAEPADAVNLIFEIFYKTVNPAINFGNLTQRNAVESLFKLLGFEKTFAAAKYAVTIQTTKYAPTITTPVQLLNKYGELQAYYAKNEIKKGMSIIKL